MPQRLSWVDEANDKVLITSVLRITGVFVPDNIAEGGNKKIFCPFGFYHSDHGLTKAMRVYTSSNTAWCFSCSKRYNPVSLAAAYWDVRWDTAALRLLEDIGYKQKTIEDRWREATSEITTSPDIVALADALKVYCASQDSLWAINQLEGDIAVTLNKCLSLLDSVKTNEDATKWLTVTKQAMTNKIHEKVS
jgi:hypothetical protein